MTRRHEARRRAVALLYEADVGGRSPLDLLEERRSLGHDVPRFTEELVRGVAERIEELDRLIGTHAEGWTVPRLAAVDRAVLRLACHEILHRDEVPAAVAVDEAVEAAKELSTEDSGRFVNGILGRIVRGCAAS
ncbi:MAG TPA: transcription antitermination factor NusB [Actinomycetota bacterium]|nr:transcription antitermination factor NusB [Actinomycetota bacterium]